MTPCQQAVIEGRGSSTFFQIPKPVQRQSVKFFQVPQSPGRSLGWNFSKSQGPYRYGSAKSNILTYSFIYCTYSFHFHHIYYIKEFPNVTSSEGKGVYSQILKLLPRSRSENFFKSPGHFFECDVIKGVEGGCTRKSCYYLAGRKNETCQKRRREEERKI